MSEMMICRCSLTSPFRMVKGSNEDNNQFVSTQRLLKALDELHASNKKTRRHELLQLVAAQYEDLYQRLDAVPHPVFGNRG